MEYFENAILLETAWEVCNQVGGIYTVIRSKLPEIRDKWGERYCLFGPWIHPNVTATFEPIEDTDGIVGTAVQRMRDKGFELHYGRWLVSGRPKVILADPRKIQHMLGDIKYKLWDHHGISTPSEDELIDNITAFGYLGQIFATELAYAAQEQEKELVLHAHEWMAGTGIPELRRENVPVKIVFTTHATMLGRYLAMNDPNFYKNLPFYDWQKEAKHFNIESQVTIERAAAHGAHLMTTVSEITNRECEHLLGRKAEALVPNGLNIKRFTATHEIQNLHGQYKKNIQQFIIGHFFNSYTFDLDKTMFFFTSGRYEYKNKGFDLTLEALARLNWRLKQADMDITVVMFFITRRPYHSINPESLNSRAVMEEIRGTCRIITEQIEAQLFHEAVMNPDMRMPDLNQMVTDQWKLRLRRNLQSWKSGDKPSVITHNIYDHEKDEILSYLNASQLLNGKDDKVKIIYHPDFLSPSNPFFGIEYGEFVRGCHLGVFPSYYEPWGYTPLECLASGVPAITSDLAGFGDYSMQSIPDPEANGLYIVQRKDRSFNDAAHELTDKMFDFLQFNRRERIAQRYDVEKTSLHFDWKNLASNYQLAYYQVLGGE